MGRIVDSNQRMWYTSFWEMCWCLGGVCVADVGKAWLNIWNAGKVEGQRECWTVDILRGERLDATTAEKCFC